MNFDNMKAFLDYWAEEFTPGCQIVVYKDNKKVFSYHTGYADVENNIKLCGNELFNLYSCSKVATVTAALQLYEKGVFLLNDPLYEYIPEFKEMYYKDAEGNLAKCQKPITMRDLFTMTAGFDYNFKAPSFAKANELTNGKNDTLEVVRLLASEPLSFEPGEKWQYSLCHDVLGAAVQAMTGKRFSQYVKENIFDPLEMTESYYHIPEVRKKDMAQQYAFDDGVYNVTSPIECKSTKQSSFGTIYRVDNAVSHILGDEYDSGGAGITSSCEDYAKFVVALANFGTGLTGERILSPATINLMRTNHLNDHIRSYTWDDLIGYGYGLGVRTMMNPVKGGNLSNLGEFGWSGAAGSFVVADPDANLAMFFTQHIINPRAAYFLPRLTNVLYSCI